MKITKLVTRAIVYNRETREEEQRMYVGRHTKLQIEKLVDMPVVELNVAKAIIDIPDEIVNQHMKIEEA